MPLTKRARALYEDVQQQQPTEALLHVSLDLEMCAHYAGLILDEVAAAKKRQRTRRPCAGRTWLQPPTECHNKSKYVGPTGRKICQGCYKAYKRDVGLARAVGGHAE